MRAVCFYLACADCAAQAQGALPRGEYLGEREVEGFRRGLRLA
jgi:hypothetical protein